MDFKNQMQVSNSSAYKSELIFLIAMTLIFGFCCLIFGYLALPIAAGFYASLLSTEKKENRIFSYIAPLVPLVANVFINGFYSFEAIAYVVVGAVIFYGYDRRKNKAFFSFFASAILILFILLSMLFLAFDKLGTFKFSAAFDFYSELYEVGKTEFVSFLTSFTSVDSEKFVFYDFNAYDAVRIYNTIVISFIPLFVIAAFVTVGISSKILSTRMNRYNPNDDRLITWKFVTTPFFSYSYIAFTALAALSSEGILGLSFNFISSILMAVYFYIGINATYVFICEKKGSRFAITVISLTVVLFFSFVTQIISFIGVFVNNAVYKNKNSTDADIS